MERNIEDEVDRQLRLFPDVVPQLWRLNNLWLGVTDAGEDVYEKS